MKIAKFQLSPPSYTSFDWFQSEPDSEPVKISDTISPPHTPTAGCCVLAECVEFLSLYLDLQTTEPERSCLTQLPVIPTPTVGQDIFTLFTTSR